MECDKQHIRKDQKEALEKVDNKNIIDGLLQKLREPTSRKFAIPVKRQRDTRLMTGVTLPKEGGILSHFSDCPYPMQGFPVAEAVQQVDRMKKNLISVLSGFRMMFQQNKIKTLIFLILFRKEYKIGIARLVSSMWMQMRPYDLKPRFYCRSVRELNRVFLIMRSREPDKANEFRIQQIARIIANVLEFDDAYRYRFQDIIGQLDKVKFEERPIVELQRLVAIGESSEGSPRHKNTWIGAKLALKLIKFTPHKKDVILFFSHLNIEEIKLSAGDYYYASQKVKFQWHKPPELSLIQKSNSTKKMPDDEKVDAPAEGGEAEAPKEGEGEAKKDDE